MKKRWIIPAGVVLALGAVATVAVAERGEEMREHRRPMPCILGRLDLTDEQREQLQMGILTEEQQETLGEMRGRFFDRRGGEGPFSRLDLTDEQKERLKELRTEHRTEMRETRNNHHRALESVLTDEQREELEAMKDEAFYGGGRRWRGKR